MEVEKTEDATIVTYDDPAGQGQMPEVETPGSEEEVPAQEEPSVTEEAPLAAEEAAPVDEYSPDFSYRVLDSEKEIPEEFREFIKSKELEDKFRDLHTMAGSADYFKEKLTKTKESAEEATANFNTMKTFVESIQNLAEKDVDTLFQVLKVNPESVMGYAKRYLDVQEMSPADQARYEQDQQIRAENYQNQQRLSQIEQQQQHQMLMNHQQQMEQALSQGEVEAFRREFDSRMGEGAFKSHVMEYGNQVYNQSKTNVPPLQAVMDTYNKFKKLLPVDQQHVQGAQTQQPQQQRMQPIPQVGNQTSASPHKRRIRSFDDIKKDYEVRYGQR